MNAAGAKRRIAARRDHPALHEALPCLCGLKERSIRPNNKWSTKKEFGVRIALGAGWQDIQRLVLVEAGRLIGFGIVIGAALAFAGKRVLEGLLFGIRPTDPMTYVGMSAVLAVVALLACQIPAVRAARIDPLRALRAE